VLNNRGMIKHLSKNKIIFIRPRKKAGKSQKCLASYRANKSEGDFDWIFQFPKTLYGFE